MLSLKDIKKVNKSLRRKEKELDAELDRLAEKNRTEYQQLDKRYKAAWKRRYKILREAIVKYNTLIKYLKCTDCQNCRRGDSAICRLVFEPKWEDELEQFLIEGDPVNPIIKNIKKAKLSHQHGLYSICTEFTLCYGIISGIIHKYFPHTFTQNEYTPPHGYNDAWDPYGSPGYYSDVTYNDQGMLLNIKEKLLDEDQTKVRDYIKEATARLKEYGVENSHEIILSYITKKIK